MAITNAEIPIGKRGISLVAGLAQKQNQSPGNQFLVTIDLKISSSPFLSKDVSKFWMPGFHGCLHSYPKHFLQRVIVWPKAATYELREAEEWKRHSLRVMMAKMVFKMMCFCFFFRLK